MTVLLPEPFSPTIAIIGKSSLNCWPFHPLRPLILSHSSLLGQADGFSHFLANLLMSVLSAILVPLRASVAALSRPTVAPRDAQFNKNIVYKHKLMRLYRTPPWILALN